MSLVIITTDDPNLESQCKQLAEKYAIPYCDPDAEKRNPGEHSSTKNAPTYILKLNQEYVSLIKSGDPKLKPFHIDFCQGKLAHRGTRANKELLGKAISLKKLNTPKVLDATAGLGRDGFLLASLGCEVVLIEQNPVLYLLLDDALKRYEKYRKESGQPQLNLKLLHQDAIEFLKSSDTYPVIYLDPMFPERNKSALVKKEMRFLHDIVGPSENDSALLEISLQKAEKRVVVKRPLHAEFLANRKPDFSYKGKAIRFDIYLAKPSKETIEMQARIRKFKGKLKWEGNLDKMRSN